MARGLERYHITGSVPEATETIMGRLEVASEQQESELSMLRYLVWAIPPLVSSAPSAVLGSRYNVPTKPSKVTSLE